MGKKIYKISKYVIGCLFLVVVLLLSVYLLKKTIKKSPVTEMFGYSFYYVETGSMEPYIKVGSLIVVKKHDSDYYQVGMNVTYLREGAKTTVTHQIVERDGNTIVTRGMNEETNNTNDEPFDVSCIVGEVTKVYENYYKFMDFVKSPIGIICLALIGFIVIEGIGYLDKIILKNEKETKEESVEEVKTDN